MNKTLVGFLAATILAVSIPALAAEGDEDTSGDSQSSAPAGGQQDTAPTEEHATWQITDFLRR
jgi:uncharacterized protein YdeI (BOF family)